MPFLFLELASELRIRILEYLTHHSTSIDLSLPHPNFPFSLLLTSHQIYDEAHHLFWNRNTFLLPLHRDTTPLIPFLSPYFLSSRMLIRSLRLETHRWGTKTFFLDEVVPSLKQMILEGRLRVLHVKARKSHIFDGFDVHDVDLLRDGTRTDGFDENAMQKFADMLVGSNNSTLTTTNGDSRAQDADSTEEDSAALLQQMAAQKCEIEALRARIGKWRPVQELIRIMEDPYLEEVKFEVWRVFSRGFGEDTVEEETFEDVTRVLRRDFEGIRAF